MRDGQAEAEAGAGDCDGQNMKWLVLAGSALRLAAPLGAFVGLALALSVMLLVFAVVFLLIALGAALLWVFRLPARLLVRLKPPSAS